MYRLSLKSLMNQKKLMYQKKLKLHLNLRFLKKLLIR
jgi:hypothetical protein